MRRTSLTILLTPIIVVLSILATAKWDLGTRLFNNREYQEKRAAQRAAIELNIPEHDLYKTPLGAYYTSEGNLTDLLRLAGYDAGTLGKGSGFFDPNVQKEDLLRTCMKTDNGDHILTIDEIKARLRSEYGWNPKDLPQ